MRIGMKDELALAIAFLSIAVLVFMIAMPRETCTCAHEETRSDVGWMTLDEEVKEIRKSEPHYRVR